MLESFVASKPDAIEARFALARLLAGAGRNEAARAQFESVLQTEPENPTLLFALAQLAWQSEQPDAAERYLQRYLALPDTVNRNPSPAWLFLGQISESGGRIDEAIERYSKVDRGEQYIPALVRRVLLIARQGRVEEARQLLRSTRVTTNRERVQLISAEAQVLREARRFDDALTLLSNALERLPENPDLLYDHAMAAERVGRLDLLEGSLRKLISLRPDHAHAYNALGYTFADRNIRLQEARELIEKALDLRPDDAHILDSMGWVRYRLGDLDGALDFLRRAWRASREAEIGVHLGEILWVRGEREEARAVFRESRELDPNNEVLRETLQRLGVGP
jgi:tetratricopeptide (TPR) repeat protein